MLILAIADAHIPDRAISLPPKLRKLLVPGKISQVLSLGNTSAPQLESLFKTISKDVQSVKGEFDTDPALPLSKVVTYGQLRIGLVSGFTIIPNDDPDALLIMARQLDVDILLWGGSHRVETYELEGKFFVNPGSVTGAFSHGWSDSSEVTPSFCLLDIQGLSCVIYIYSIVNDNVKVEKAVFKKVE